MGFPRWPWRASCIVVCPSLRRPSAPPPDSAHPVSRGQFPAISSLPAGLSQAVATPFFSWGLRVVPLPIFGFPAVSPSTELPSARLPPAHFSLRADTLRGSMQRHCGCAKFLPFSVRHRAIDSDFGYTGPLSQLREVCPCPTIKTPSTAEISW